MHFTPLVLGVVFFLGLEATGVLIEVIRRFLALWRSVTWFC